MTAALTRHDRDGIAWYSLETLQSLGAVVAGASTRHGGVSEGDLASLNLSFAVGDDPDRVTENRNRLIKGLGLDRTRVTCAAQVHGHAIAIVDDKDAGAGFAEGKSPVPSVDGLVTNTPGLALWLGFADCVPIAAYDPVRNVIGVAHAGWRGTLGRIAGELVRSMAASFGTKPAEAFVAVGPSIGPCCYRVGSDLTTAFVDNWGERAAGLCVNHDDGPHFDLWEANVRCLTAAGVQREHIEVSRLCTACHVDDFYSHRAQAGKAGRFAVVVALV